MTTPGNGRRVKRRVWVALVLVSIGASGGWFWLRSRIEDVQAGGAGTEPFVRVSGPEQGGRDRAVRERAELFDPAPLFLPTSRNFGQGPLPARLAKQPGQVFADFGAKVSFAEGGLEAFGAETLASPESLAEVLSRSNEVPFAGLGEAGGRRPQLPTREAVLQIKRMGEKGLSEVVLAGIGVPDSDFAPLEFVVAVGPAGLIGDPILTSGSGRDRVDAFFQDYLVKTYRLGARLEPGRYRVMIGP